MRLFSIPPRGVEEEVCVHFNLKGKILTLSFRPQIHHWKDTVWEVSGLGLRAQPPHLNLFPRRTILGSQFHDQGAVGSWRIKDGWHQWMLYTHRTSHAPCPSVFIDQEMATFLPAVREPDSLPITTQPAGPEHSPFPMLCT